MIDESFFLTVTGIAMSFAGSSTRQSPARSSDSLSGSPWQDLAFGSLSPSYARTVCRRRPSGSQRWESLGLSAGSWQPRSAFLRRRAGRSIRRLLVARS